MKKQNDICLGLEDLVKVEKSIIEKYFGKGDFIKDDTYNIKNYNEKVEHFIKECAPIIKDMYCYYICKYKDECSLKKRLD